MLSFFEWFFDRIKIIAIEHSENELSWLEMIKRKMQTNPIKSTYTSSINMLSSMHVYFALAFYVLNMKKKTNGSNSNGNSNND